MINIHTELQSICERTQVKRACDIDRCRPVEIGMSVGLAIRVILKKALEAGYTKMELSVLVSDIAKELLEESAKRQAVAACEVNARGT